jgi:hypothetical protein
MFYQLCHNNNKHVYAAVPDNFTQLKCLHIRVFVQVVVISLLDDDDNDKALVVYSIRFTHRRAHCRYER